MQLKIILLALVVAVSVSGCVRKPTCQATVKYSKIVGDGLGDFLGCKNKVQIALDVQDKIEELKLCEEIPTGPIAMLVCKPVASYVTKQIVKRSLPKKWECSGGLPGAGLETAIYQACSQLPF